MPKNLHAKSFHAITMAAAAGAGLLLVSASPSLACYATASPCWQAPTPGAQPPAPIVHRGARLYNLVPSGSTIDSPRPHRAPQRDAATPNTK